MRSFGSYLENVRKLSPLVHNITNYVTVNDCANILLAAGASPIMADDIGEAAEITKICAGLNINIGTLNASTIAAMHAALKAATEEKHATLLDPVGAGASALRTNTALALIEQARFTVIRGNASEIKTIALGAGGTKGVDVNPADAMTGEGLMRARDMAVQLAKRTNSIIGVTGETDVVTDGERTFFIMNGNALMPRVTGSGCMLSALTTAYIAAERLSGGDDMLGAVAAAFAAMGAAGETALERMGKEHGNATFRNYMIDAIFAMTGSVLDERARYEAR